MGTILPEGGAAAWPSAHGVFTMGECGPGVFAAGYHAPMHRPGTDPDNVQMTDIMCDFCHRAWTEEAPMMEGHQGSCICGNCLSLAYAEVVNAGENVAGDDDWLCALCLERSVDREALNRAGEPGWRSPLHEEATICRRCIKLAAGVLQKDPDHKWARPS